MHSVNKSPYRDISINVCVRVRERERERVLVLLCDLMSRGLYDNEF